MKQNDTDKASSEATLPKVIWLFRLIKSILTFLHWTNEIAQWPGATTTPPVRPRLDHPTSSALLNNPSIEAEYRDKYHYEINR